ncbi:MAG TPA: hypothetical protein VIE88_13625 [Vicinamibacteria bacterium]
MRCIRTLVLTTLALGLVSGVTSAQSLAEVAKKEKERRGKNSTGSSRTITDRELATSFGGLPPASSTVSTTPAGGEAAAPKEGEGTEGAPPDEKKTPEYWQNRMKASKEKIAKLEETLKSDDWGAGQKVGVDPRGANNLGTRQEAEKQLAAARSELEAVRAEARKAGVPPGWVR